MLDDAAVAMGKVRRGEPLEAWDRVVLQMVRESMDRLWRDVQRMAAP